MENNNAGTTREGLSSHFLARGVPGEPVRVSVRQSSFRAPANLSSSPVIMVSHLHRSDGRIGDGQVECDAEADTSFLEQMDFGRLNDTVAIDVV